jgi:hypothetical protein
VPSSFQRVVSPLAEIEMGWKVEKLYYNASIDSNLGGKLTYKCGIAPTSDFGDTSSPSPHTQAIVFVI